jgi:hypothetical protein
MVQNRMLCGDRNWGACCRKIGVAAAVAMASYLGGCGIVSGLLARSALTSL